MKKNGFDRRDMFKLAGAGAGAGIIGGALTGVPSTASAGMIDGLQLIRGMGQRRELDPNAGLSVILLGTGIPLPSLNRACAATLVIAGDRAVMIDSGKFSSIRQIQAGITNPDLLLYTHFHSDHITDFGEIMINRFAMAGEDKPLPVIGPVGVKQLMSDMMSVYGPDKKYRVDHHEWAVNEHGYDVDVHESQPGVVYDEDGLQITMFEVDHLPVTPAVAYRFDYKGQSVVVSGDTIKVPKMIEMSEGCDILVHEAMNLQMLEIGRRTDNAFDNERRDKISADITDYHTPTHDVAEIARDAKVKKLVLTHMIPSPLNQAMEAMFIRGMRKIYKGPIKVGHDLMEVKV